MATNVTIDIFHLVMKVPERLAQHEAIAIVEVFSSRSFQAALREAARDIVRSHAALRRVQVTLSR